MGFLGLIISKDEKTFDIPAGFTMQLFMACLDLNSVGEKDVSTLYMRPGGQPTSYILCNLRRSGELNCAIQQEYSMEDGPVTLWCSKGTIHVTGRWAMSEDDEEEDDEEEEEEERPLTLIEKRQQREKAEREAEAASAKQTEVQSGHKRDRQEAETVPKSDPKQTKKAKQDVQSSSPTGVSASAPNTNPITSATAATKAATKAAVKATAKEKAEQAKLAKSVKQAEEEELLLLAAMMAPAHRVEIAKLEGEKARKKWKVRPEGDEGVVVPEPRQKSHSSGVLYTDYIIGRGIEPKLGGKIKILYEGSFPDGTVFDSRLKKSKPFVFRKGATEVIRGLDLGVEGMRVGGSREIIVPAALGYVQKIRWDDV